MLHATPREEQICELLERRPPFRGHFEVALVDRGFVRRLHQHAAGDALVIERAAVLAREAPTDDRVAGNREYLQILSLPKGGQGLVLVPGRDQRLVERPLTALRHP